MQITCGMFHQLPPLVSCSRAGWEKLRNRLFNETVVGPSNHSGHQEHDSHVILSPSSERDPGYKWPD